MFRLDLFEMAVPKKKTSKSKRNQRHAVWKAKAATAAQKALSIGKSVLSGRAQGFVYPVEFNWVLFTVSILLAGFLMPLRFNIRRVIFYQYIGSILYMLIMARGWGLWALSTAIPNSKIVEPLFNSDVSFSLVKYPAIITFLTPTIFLTSLTIVLSFWEYLIKGTNLSDWSTPTLGNEQKNYMRPLCSFILIMFSYIIWLSRYEFLWSTNGTFPGAGWLDIHFNIPIRTLTAIFIFLYGIMLLPVFNRNFRRYIRIFSITFTFISVPLEILFTPILNWMVVRPRELNLETPYIQRAIDATRKAFQLDSIKTRLINPQPLSKRDVNLGQSTLRNIRLWDSQPLLATNRQLQQLRVYYRFSSPAVDRYRLIPDSDERQQVIITARELDQEALPSSSRTWLNRHFVFTHGYGFTISPVNTRAMDGLPEYFISDLGASTKIEGNQSLGISKSSVKEAVPIGRAALYYGLLDSPYAVAPTKLEELDYPEGDQNIFNHYSGKGGIPLENIWQKISAAVYLREPRLLNTGSLTKESKLLIRREVRERIKSVAPFLETIGDPYLVSVSVDSRNKGYSFDQNQFWIAECYTSSRTYPYSSMVSDKSQLRYLRNSVKAIVDAYSGQIKFYISESNDPIILGWKKLFPTLFENIDNMPISIRDHLKVPTHLFDIQVQQLLRYHVTDPRTFYNGDDVWEVPKELYGREQVPVEPYYITAQLKPNEKSEFLLLQPLSPLARPNLAAWLAARSDGKNYGELVLLRFPSETSIFGPEQIQALINQDPKISQQFSLWDRAGSEVIQGNLLVLPLGRALLYVEPVYLKASQGGLPTLTRVVVSDGKRIAMASSLADGIKELLEDKQIIDK